MKEVVQAPRAIWDCWQHGTPLHFQGRSYRFALMTSFFNPGPIAHPRIPDRGGGGRNARAVEKQIAFYASTRTYQAVLAVHGLEDLVPRRRAKSLAGEWEGWPVSSATRRSITSR